MRIAAFLVFALAIITLFSLGYISPSKTKDVSVAQAYAHPWIVHSSTFFMMVFHLQPEAVKPFLPEGLKLHLNEKGMVNATFEMYETEEIAGLPHYKVAFIVVDIENRPSRTGAPGHFALWGRVNTQQSLDFFKREFGFPYHLAAQLDVVVDQAEYSGVISSDQGELLTVNIDALEDNEFVGNGVIDMLSIRPDTGLVKAEVPYITKAHFGKVISLYINPQGDPVLSLLKSSKPEWALVADDQTFAYSHAISVEQ